MFEPIQATWTFSSEELVAHRSMLSRRAGIHRKQDSHGTIVLVAILVFCSIAAALAPTAGFLVGLLCFGVVMLCWTVVYLLSKRGDARLARHWAREVMAAGPETVEITQTHLRFREAAGGIDTTIKWSRVVDVGSAGAALTIWLNDIQALMLPKRVFKPDEVDRILALRTSVKLARTCADVPDWLVRAPEHERRSD